MGRKKKAAVKRDARGYQQGNTLQRNNPETCTKNVRPVKITASTQERLERLLNDLRGKEDREEESPTCMPSATPSDRFYKKVGNIYDRLRELGFAFEQIKSAVSSIGFSITLESALDWLCLHLSTQELPPMFTEGNVRDAQGATSASGDPLSVIVPSGGASGADTALSRERLALLDTMPAMSQPLSTQKDEELDASQKAWLLEQYQYVEDEDDGEGIDTNDGQNKVLTTQHETETETAIMSVDEIRLQEVKQELREKEADLADDAANYMRSKHEIKELQKEVKHLHKQVQGLQRRVEKRKAQLENEQIEGAERQETEAFDEPADDDPGIFSIFEAEELDQRKECTEPTNGDAVSSVDSSLTPAVEIPIDSIPENWTGQTPKTILEELCRRQKIAEPVFRKLALNGCLVRINHSPPVELTQAGPLSSYLDAQQYVATKALYQLNPELPLYRLLPPFYRSLWKSWSAEVQVQKGEEKQEKEEDRLEKVERLIAAIPTAPVVSSGTAVSSENDDADFRQHGVVESWDDEVEMNALPSTLHEITPSLVDEQLRASFIKRQRSSSYQQMLSQRSRLPIHAYRKEFLDSVRNNQVSVLCAETGAGKTTQCPVFLLEEAMLDGRGAQTSILCTQPRRIAAISVAERVAEEMCENSGKLVGYQIRLESRRSQETRLLFCTTGVVLRRLVEDPALSGITHVVVDEVRCENVFAWIDASLTHLFS